MKQEGANLLVGMHVGLNLGCFAVLVSFKDEDGTLSEHGCSGARFGNMRRIPWIKEQIFSHTVRLCMGGK